MTQLCMVMIGMALTAGVLAQAPKPAAKDAKAAAALDGTWVLTSINGEPLSDELTLTIAGGKYHQTVGGTINERGTIKIDASKKPMTIDLAITEGSDAGKTQLGIVEVTGDTISVPRTSPSRMAPSCSWARKRIRHGGTMLSSLVLTLLIVGQQPPTGTQHAGAEKPWPPAGVVRLDKSVTAPRLIKESRPRYTDDAKRARIQGVVHVEVVVKTDGTVGDTRVTQSLDKEFGLDNRAVEAVKEWRFVPGQKDGVPVPVLVEIELTFTLR